MVLEREGVRTLRFMLVAACVLAGGGVVADLAFPVTRGFPDDLERLWSSTGVMVGFSLAVYIPAVGLAMVLLVARRWGKAVVAQEVVAALAGLTVATVAFCWWFGVFDSGETLATGIPVTAHVLHFPTLCAAVCASVAVSCTPLFRRWRSYRGCDGFA